MDKLYNKSNESHNLEEMLERKEKLAPAGSRTQDNLRPKAGFQQPKPTNQAGTIPFHTNITSESWLSLDLSQLQPTRSSYVKLE